MFYYSVEVFDKDMKKWEPLTGFDVDSPDIIVWNAGERLSAGEAEDRLDLLKGQQPSRVFRISKMNLPS